MIELIKNLNENNVKDFIEKYGKVKDIELAIELLCLTSNAWLILDDSVKLNSNVIMYYQPMGHLSEEFVENFGGVYESIEVDNNHLDGPREISQKGFKVVKGIQIPKIEFPIDFNLEMYVDIQKELAKSYQKLSISHISWVDSDKINELEKNILFDHLQDPTPEIRRPIELEKYYEIYDRSKLADIVKNNFYSVQEKNRTI